MMSSMMPEPADSTSKAEGVIAGGPRCPGPRVAGTHVDHPAVLDHVAPGIDRAQARAASLSRVADVVAHHVHVDRHAGAAVGVVRHGVVSLPSLDRAHAWSNRAGSRAPRTADTCPKGPGLSIRRSPASRGLAPPPWRDAIRLGTRPGRRSGPRRPADLERRDRWRRCRPSRERVDDRSARRRTGIPACRSGSRGRSRFGPGSSGIGPVLAGRSAGRRWTDSSSYRFWSRTASPSMSAVSAASSPSLTAPRSLLRLKYWSCRAWVSSWASVTRT